MSLFQFYPKYSSFKEYLKKSDNPMATWKIILLYPLALLGIFLATIIVVGIVKAISSSDTCKYPPNKYKKVIKKGILWDTTEYHEIYKL